MSFREIKVEYIDQLTGVINGGSKYRFKGIVRGACFSPITYFYDDVEDLKSLVTLSEWIYKIDVNNGMEKDPRQRVL